MSDTPKIYESISAIMAEVTAISKSKRNEQQGFMYRGIDDVYNMAQPIFAKYGVFAVVQQREPMIRTEGTTKHGNIMHKMHAMYDVRFYAKDGSFVTVTLEAEGMDSADKGTNKCHSVAHKYALLTLLMVPTEDMAEPDATTPEPATFKKPDPAPVPAPAVISSSTLTQLNTTGRAMYGAEWDSKRPELVKAKTKGRTTSSTELTESEAVALISGIRAKMEEREREEADYMNKVAETFGGERE